MSAPTPTNQAPVTTTEYFGGCPECGKTDGYVNVGRDHWMSCKEHKTRWYVGSNLFSSWRDESREEQQAALDRMGFSDYREVEPIYPAERFSPIPPCEAGEERGDFDDLDRQVEERAYINRTREGAALARYLSAWVRRDPGTADGMSLAYGLARFLWLLESEHGLSADWILRRVRFELDRHTRHEPDALERSAK